MFNTNSKKGQRVFDPLLISKKISELHEMYSGICSVVMQKFDKDNLDIDNLEKELF
jgi:hypothetical protein